jgi:hypothetical protein
MASMHYETKSRLTEDTMTHLSKLLLTAAIVSLSVAAHAAPSPRTATAELQQGPYSQGAYGQSITCSSDDGKRNYCNIDTRRGVQLIRQISGSPCIQNSTWGYDDRGLWVDRGCRAEFSTGGYGPGNPWQQGQGQTITCSSDDGKRNYCDVDTRRGVQLTRQISGSPCIQNSTWGYDNRGLWVDRGCRAEFSAGGYGNGNGNQWQPGQQGQIITCSSDNGKRNYCATDGLDPGSAALTRQISGSECRRNYSWGVDRRGLWVDRGCRAEFQLTAGYR